jgi:hypothetical protein
MTCRDCSSWLWRKRCRNPCSLRSRINRWRTVIERGAHDFQFRVLIVHRGLYVAVPHRSHYCCKLAGSHQNSRTVVMSRTVENQLFRKACFIARFSEQIANRPQMPSPRRFDGNTQPSCLASHLIRRISKTRPLIGTSRRPSAVLLSGTKLRGSANPGSRYASGRVLFRSSFLCRGSR